MSMAGAQLVNELLTLPAAGLLTPQAAGAARPDAAPLTHPTLPRAQVVYDINGREAAEAEPLLRALKPSLEQYIYCSSAGVYLKSEQMPHREEDAVDPKSRHKVRACRCVRLCFFGGA